MVKRAEVTSHAVTLKANSGGQSYTGHTYSSHTTLSSVKIQLQLRLSLKGIIGVNKQIASLLTGTPTPTAAFLVFQEAGGKGSLRPIATVVALLVPHQKAGPCRSLALTPHLPWRLAPSAIRIGAQPSRMSFLI